MGFDPDALRKAQEDTGARQQPPVGEHPATETVVPSPRQRRRVGWPVVVLGNSRDRVRGWTGARRPHRRALRWIGDAPAPAADARLTQHVTTQRRQRPPDVKQVDAPAASPAVRRGRRPAQGAGDAPAPLPPPPAAMGDGKAAAQQRHRTRRRPARTPARVRGRRAGAARPQNDDRMARLQQLREKMLKARRRRGARGAPEEAPPPAQIFVPPPHDAAPARAPSRRPHRRRTRTERGGPERTRRAGGGGAGPSPRAIGTGTGHGARGSRRGRVGQQRARRGCRRRGARSGHSAAVRTFAHAVALEPPVTVAAILPPEPGGGGRCAYRACGCGDVSRAAGAPGARHRSRSTSCSGRRSRDAASRSSASTAAT